MIQIGEMVIRIPGASRADALGVGEEVTSALAERFPTDFQNRSIEALDVRLSVSASMGKTEMINAIVDQIIIQLKQA